MQEKRKMVLAAAKFQGKIRGGSKLHGYMEGLGGEAGPQSRTLSTAIHQLLCVVVDINRQSLTNTPPPPSFGILN